MAHIGAMQTVADKVTMTGQVLGARVLFGTAVIATTAAMLPVQHVAPATTTMTAAGPENSAYRRSIAWGALKARVIRWSSLPDDWDGNDGVAPSATVVENAKNFIALAARLGAPVPVPFIAGDGEIGFRWAKGNRFGSVSFVEGDVLAYVWDGERKLRLDQPYSADDAAVASVLAALATFA